MESLCHKTSFNLYRRGGAPKRFHTAPWGLSINYLIIYFIERASNSPLIQEGGPSKIFLIRIKKFVIQRKIEQSFISSNVEFNCGFTTFTNIILFRCRCFIVITTSAFRSWATETCNPTGKGRSCARRQRHQ